MELPQYHLRDAKERDALNRLIPTGGDWENLQEFQGYVLAYLALIGEKYSGAVRPKPERSAQKLRHHATKIRKFAHWLESSKPKGVIIVLPSTSELLRYADSLSSVADFRALESQTRRLRHSTHNQTNLILRLLYFVREQTGKPHFPEIVTLLRGACRDHGMNERRLQALCSRIQKRPSWRRAAFRHVPPSPRVTL
jgi:hypothetical protein